MTIPRGKKGDVLTVDFTVLGIPCLGLNGGPAFKHSEAFSFQVATDTQEETDRYWNAIVGNGGQESECGWCKDRWGLSWQITPRVLTDAMAAGGAEAKRAFDAMMTMRKIDVAAIEAARRGESRYIRDSDQRPSVAGRFLAHGGTSFSAYRQHLARHARRVERVLASHARTRTRSRRIEGEST